MLILANNQWVIYVQSELRRTKSKSWFNLHKRNLLLVFALRESSVIINFISYTGRITLCSYCMAEAPYILWRQSAPLFQENFGNELQEDHVIKPSTCSFAIILLVGKVQRKVVTTMFSSEI